MKKGRCERMTSVSDVNETRLRISSGTEANCKNYRNISMSGLSSLTVLQSYKDIVCPPKHDGGGGLASVVRERSAPAVSRTRTQSSLPASQASKRGVWPSAVGASTAAPAARSTSTQLEEGRGEGDIYTNCMFCGLHSPPAEMFSPHHATYRRCI